MELDEEHIKLMLRIINKEINELDIKITEGIKDPYCSYDLFENLSSCRRGLNYLKEILEKKLK